MGTRMCRKGKSCGATCIDRRERCNIELGPLVSPAVKKVSLGLGSIFRRGIEAGKAERLPSVPSDMKRELAALAQPRQLDRSPGARTRTAPEVRRELANIVQAAKKGEMTLMMDDISRIMRGSIPQNIQVASAKDELGMKARIKTPPDVLKKESSLGDLAKIPTSQLVRLRQRVLDAAVKAEDAFDNSRHEKLVSQWDKIDKELSIRGAKARVKGSGTQAGSASADTKWSRGDAKDFDGSFKIYKRIRGDKDMIDWDETVRNGKQIGEGSFGTVMRVGNVAHKRGEVSANEANIIKKAGELGIGPRLLGAEISTKRREGYGVDLHDGRIAMSVVPGKQMGDVKADSKVAGKNVSDIYWKAMADLHRAGIAHNDAHVENILIDNKGKGRWVDFGLAQDNPRAALAEALGSFKHLKGGDDISVPGSARGNGNWQARGWDATGYKLADRAKEKGGKTWEEFQQRFPVASRVWSNQDNVIKKLEKAGLDTNEINSMIEHGIRSPLSSYNDSPGFSRITDKQAQDLLNTLYDGI